MRANLNPRRPLRLNFKNGLPHIKNEIKFYRAPAFTPKRNFSQGANPLTPRNLAETKGQCFEQNQPKQGSNFS
ncbi:hypothetical protein [uncultured Campylobacter sp.]|uniref:hypothetical protein n=1 Tax=uncultured Campylobacter sp. TaxID=218934 RepID=UPI0026323CA5|nr:hypothetical protein [uncultured Campylobacter sp.]